jgi:hypothetical protein
MKPINCIPISILWILFILTFSVQPLKSQNSPNVTPNDSIKLPGSTFKEEDVAPRSDSIFIGEIMDMGPSAPTSPGTASFNGVRVKVLQILRGSIGSEITVEITSFALEHEALPKVGSSYIFFVKKDGDRFTAVKLLPATDDHITKVKGLIAAAPAGK